MPQIRHTIQQHYSNMRFPVKLSHINMYHCETPASNIFPGHPYSKLIFIQKGSGKFLFENQYVCVQKNDILLSNPNKHRFSVELEDSPLDFTILGIENLIFAYDSATPVAPFTKLNILNSAFFTLMDLLIREIETCLPSYKEACSYYTNLLLIEILRETKIIYNENIKNKGVKDCNFIKDYLDHHFSENITLDVLSEKSNLNKYYLVHSFTKSFGCSPINYLNEKRIEESKQLLEKTDYSIADIARMIGYSSQSYFSQSFKKNTFMTPNEYRHSVRQL